jgi:hypothetical protein
MLPGKKNRSLAGIFHALGLILLIPALYALAFASGWAWMWVGLLLLLTSAVLVLSAAWVRRCRKCGRLSFGDDRSGCRQCSCDPAGR